MAYKIIVSPRAQKEIENTIDYYALYSTDAPVNFITTLKESYLTLETNPFLRVFTGMRGKLYFDIKMY